MKLLDIDKLIEELNKVKESTYRVEPFMNSIVKTSTEFTWVFEQLIEALEKSIPEYPILNSLKKGQEIPLVPRYKSLNVDSVEGN